MATIPRRYSPEEFQRLTELIYPEERRYEFTNKSWAGEGFRHYRDPDIVCIEHYWPLAKPVLPGALSRPPRHRKPAA